jgi:osmotically-inducible protein OsmY
MAQQPTLDIETMNDIDIYEAVVEAVEGVDMVRESRAPISVKVEQGVVTLTGVVISETMKRAVIYYASSVTGVVKVVDQVYEDPKLRIASAVALAYDPLTAQYQTTITTTSYLGMVTLSGPALPQDVQSKAKEIVASVPGVREVFTRFGYQSG